MNRTITWVILGALVVLFLLLLAILPARRPAVAPSPTAIVQVGRPIITATPVPTPTPTLTPEQAELSDLETETGELQAAEDLDADLQAIDAELRGI